jgi:hypothetical protein
VRGRGFGRLRHGHGVLLAERRLQKGLWFSTLSARRLCEARSARAAAWPWPTNQTSYLQRT